MRSPAPAPAERPTAPRLTDDRATHCIPVSPVLAVSKASSPEVSPPSAARPFTLPHLPLALGVEPAPPPAYPRTAAEPTRSAPPPKPRRRAAAFAATALAIAIAAALLSAITAAPPPTRDTSSATALPTGRGADEEAAARGRRAPIASETPETIPVAAVHPERGAGAEPPARARSTPAVETSSSTAVHPDRGAVAEAPPRGRGSCTSVIVRGRYAVGARGATARRPGTLARDLRREPGRDRRSGRDLARGPAGVRLRRGTPQRRSASSYAVKSPSAIASSAKRAACRSPSSRIRARSAGSSRRRAIVSRSASTSCGST